MTPGIREIELAGLKAWPGIEVEYDGAWVRRAAGGYTKRVNSVQCLDPADDGNLPARIAASRRWFESRHLPPIFRITALSAPAVNVIAAASARRRGYARAVMRSGLAWAVETGAGNALYASIDYALACGYHYRRPAA
jgi:hypothetical protein